MMACQVEGEGPIMITWRRNGVAVPTGARAEVLPTGELLIRNFQKRRDSNETDAGEYECAAQNRYGMLISRKARVQLACEYGRNPHQVQSVCVCVYVLVCVYIALALKIHLCLLTPLSYKKPPSI